MWPFFRSSPSTLKFLGLEHVRNLLFHFLADVGFKSCEFDKYIFSVCALHIDYIEMSLHYDVKIKQNKKKHVSKFIYYAHWWMLNVGKVNASRYMKSFFAKRVKITTPYHLGVSIQILPHGRFNKVKIDLFLNKRRKRSYFHKL